MFCEGVFIILYKKVKVRIAKQITTQYLIK